MRHHTDRIKNPAPLFPAAFFRFFPAPYPPGSDETRPRCSAAQFCPPDTTP